MGGHLGRASFRGRWPSPTRNSEPTANTASINAARNGVGRPAIPLAVSQSAFHVSGAGQKRLRDGVLPHEATYADSLFIQEHPHCGRVDSSVPHTL